MTTDNFERNRRFMAEMLHDGFDSAEKSHKLLFKSDKNLTISLAYLMEADTFFTNAKVFYFQKEELYHNDIEELFHQFQVYKKEFMDCVATDHLHQWTDIEFRRLKEIFEGLNSLLILN
ncbi:hypothetical protein [Priestia taiwanensis]|uniref:Uncharacterized protein n=1 Tax=Priestia taiwanensis TaxID=1347902 RepID=A0A917AK16_9BACI|nr:hypothetical protein [Priestia taiwanensis]MBM7361967.1 hypothetical protein [Priestia taiwanensis]GGE58398.1 hypothetical protein GCM10007140_05940 [Priestia taiwanensis]